MTRFNHFYVQGDLCLVSPGLFFSNLLNKSLSFGGADPLFFDPGFLPKHLPGALLGEMGKLKRRINLFFQA
jgi:hypothetical protein